MDKEDRWMIAIFAAGIAGLIGLRIKYCIEMSQIWREAETEYQKILAQR